MRELFGDFRGIVVERAPIVAFWGNMRIRYQFNPEAAVQVASYLLGKLGGSADKIKLMKLMYLADRDHFLRHGAPITGDDQYALPYGPVPSASLNLLNGMDSDQNPYVLKHVVSTSRQFRNMSSPGSSCLDEKSKQTLDAILAQYGQMHTDTLKNLTHKLPEFVECEVSNSSAPIPYEVILKHHAPDRFRHNRPVIDEKTGRQMACPFRQSEPDL